MELCESAHLQVKGVVDKFVSGLSALPAVVQQRVLGSQHDRWDAAIVTVCQSTAPNFLPVFVTGHDLVLLTLQAPKVRAAMLYRGLQWAAVRWFLWVAGAGSCC